jgi:hypothetical protein
MNRDHNTIRCTCIPSLGLLCVKCWGPAGKPMVTEPEVPVAPYTTIGITMYRSTTLELLNDGTLQIRLRGSEHSINLGPAREAAQAMTQAMDGLRIHFPAV